jgi:hypothetical protein
VIRSSLASVLSPRAPHHSAYVVLAEIEEPRAPAMVRGEAARRGTRTARGQYEREGAFPVFSSTDPRRRQAASLFSRGRSNVCHQIRKRWRTARRSSLHPITALAIITLYDMTGSTLVR